MGGFAIDTDIGVEYTGSEYFQTSDSKWLAEILLDKPFIPVCTAIL